MLQLVRGLLLNQLVMSGLLIYQLNSHLRVYKGFSGASTCRGPTSVPVSEGSPTSKGSSSAHKPPSAQHVGLPCD